MNNELRFREDGTFTIVQFTDVHWQNGEEPDLRTRALMQRVLEEESPDLIVFTGDVIYSIDCKEPEQSLREAVSAAAQSGIPWAAVFGNHDSESNVTRERLMEVLSEFENCLTKHTPNVGGFGNFVLQVSSQDGRTGAALYFLDSREYSTLAAVEGYGWVSRDQIDWYAAESRKLTELNGGAPLPALAFFHIPLPEYDAVWELGGCIGHKYESVCCPKLNTGLFAAMVEMGDVMGTFAGHDHINDYWGALHGIRLAYGRATGYNTYGKEGFPRGARVIRLTEGKRDFESWLRLDDGSVDYQNTRMND
ncbi:metallophosphoesterase family protein [Paenibacillus thermotolerans]|uniref:metallophosphoesterase family protein n=1 Tax=Paenibacillus thermotolerans TaxID=3027807 RepID=UPI002367D5E6|nr:MULTISPECIES: metallophosphoesterase family protein [unclassified Paenibacillus]